MLRKSKVLVFGPLFVLNATVYVHKMSECETENAANGRWYSESESEGL